MRRAAIIFLTALALSGCKSDVPKTDPFNSHPIVPPPPTGSCPVQADPAYPTNTVPAQTQPAQPGFPVNNGGQPATGGTTPTYSNSITNPSGAIGGTGAASPSTTQPSTPGASPYSPGMSPYPLGTGAGMNPGTSAPTANPYSSSRSNYGGLTGNPASGVPASNASSVNIIPPPGTAPTGGYPTSPSGANPAAAGTSPTNANPIGTFNGYNSGRYNNAPATTTPANLGSPRPTSTRPVIPNSTSTGAVPNNSTWDYRSSPRPIDDAARSGGGRTNTLLNIPSNSTSAPNAQPVTNPAASAGASEKPLGVRALQPQPVQMPIAPTAYQNPLTLPPYCASIQNQPIWEPCDGYEDGGE
jgi:hypothetical protein